MRVICDATASVFTGGWAVLRVTSINDEAEQVAWPARLHPFESTISFLVDGVRHSGAEQVDSIVETVMLEPGQAVSTGVLVSVSDRGDVLSTAGEIGLQVVVYRPGTNDQVLSNMCVIPVTDRAETSDDDAVGLTDLHAAAVDLRDGEVTDTAALAALFQTVGIQDRAWVATALLPAAPMSDDPLLLLAKQLAEEGADDATTTRSILDGVPYQPNGYV